MAKRPKPPTNADWDAERKAEAAARERERAAFVRLMSHRGMAPEDIGLIMQPPKSAEEVQRLYAADIEVGRAQGKQQVIDWLWESAAKGAAGPRVFLAKCIAGLSEKGTGVPELIPETPAEESEKPSPETMSSKLPTQAQLEKIIRFPRK